jgi:hypothetical protein
MYLLKTLNVECKELRLIPEESAHPDPYLSDSIIVIARIWGGLNIQMAQNMYTDRSAAIFFHCPAIR